jgi:small subunit ribosomal protein S20
MANIASAKKQARASLRRAAANKAVRSAVKTRVVKARRAVADGGAEAAAELGLAAISSLDRAVSKGVLHRNNAARRKSRLMRRLGAPAPEKAAAPARSKASKDTKAPAPARTAAKKAPAKKAPAKKTAK